MLSDERRQFQRLKLSKPLLATMRSSKALVLDIGLAGAFVEHHGTAEPGERFNLSFRWQGEEVEFVCAVVRSTVVDGAGTDDVMSHTGLRFVEPVDDAATHLQELMASFVDRILTAQKENAAGALGQSAGATILAKLGEARRTRARGFVSHRLRDGVWWRVPTESAKQPPDGFTVSAWEDDDEVESLCNTYENGDEETRNLIRLIAEISIVSART